jgi:hypothetical protein
LANEQGGGDLLPLDNLWTGVNNFNPTPLQTYGSTMSQGLTLTNNQYSSTPAGDNDIVSYTPSSSQGLCIYSSSTSSLSGKTPQIVLQPDGVKTTLFANGTNGVVQLNAIGGTQSKIILQATSGVFLQLNPTIDFNNLGTLSATSTTATGISSSVNFTAPSIITPSITQTADNTNITILGSGLNSAIVLNSTAGVSLKTNPTISFATFGTLTAGTSGLSSSANFTSPSFIINDGADDNYQIYSQNTGSYGLVIANTSSNLGKLTLSNGSSTLSSLTADTTGLTISTAVNLPAQTVYTPSTTYGNVSATQQFVQLAVASQGGGDASLSANQTFTGINTFSNTAQTSATQAFPQLSTNQFATYAYVNNLGSSSGVNYLTISSPQLSTFQITYTTPSGNAGASNYNAVTGVNGTLYTYIGNQYCGIINNSFGSPPNCIFNISTASGVTPTATENLSLRVMNGNTQYKLGIVVSGGVMTTTSTLSMTTGQTYYFYLQGSFF